MKQLKNLTRTFFLALTLVSGVIAGLLGLAVEPTRADGPDSAQIIVQFDRDDVIVRTISFTAPVSGYEALRLTGLDLITETSSFGLAICSIGGLGNPAGSCFSSGFWSSYYWDGADWQMYGVGAAESVINDGAVELWSWQPGFVSLDLPATRPFTAAANGLEWLRPQQSASDGGYGNSSSSVETLIAVGANKLKASEWRRQASSPSLLNYVLRNGPAFANSNVGASGKLAVGLTAAGGCWPPGAKQPVDYSATGAFSAGSGPQAWAILGTSALSQPIPALAVQNLLNQQVQSSGGWEWSPTWGTDTNSTALAIQALLAAGEAVSSTAVISGLNYLDNVQKSDGGFPYDSSYDSDTNSTAYVVQALLAGGEVLTDTRWTTDSGATPISYLLNRQLADGSFEWQVGQGSNQASTRQVIPALLGQPFPLQQSELHQCSEQEIGLSTVYLPLMVKN